MDLHQRRGKTVIYQIAKISDEKKLGAINMHICMFFFRLVCDSGNQQHRSLSYKILVRN